MSASPLPGPWSLSSPCSQVWRIPSTPCSPPVGGAKSENTLDFPGCLDEIKSQDHQARKANAPHPGRGWAHRAHQPLPDLCMRKICFPCPRSSFHPLSVTPPYSTCAQFSSLSGPALRSQTFSGNNSRSDGKVLPLPGVFTS